MTSVRQAVGAYGERCAVRHLVGSGARVIARNWRGTQGELDVVAWDGDELVFCEVKTRRNDRFGTPAEAVVATKQARLRRLAAEWLAHTGTRADRLRFDVIAVRVPRSGAARIEHLRNAF